jgi:branched-chain amino acid transport system substrate-binding protein
LLKRRKEIMRMKQKVIVVALLTMMMIGTMLSVLPIMADPDTIHIGVIGPQGMIQWDGILEGAQMAKEEINDAGGILGHNIELHPIDSHGAPPENPGAGITETLSVLEANDIRFLVGGFRTEVVGPIREAVMDFAATYDRPIWFVSGASTDYLIDSGYFPGHPSYTDSCVRGNYSRYRYMFRVTPMNTTHLFKQFAAFLKTYILPDKLAKIYGSPVKTYLVIEDLDWADLMAVVLLGSTYVPYLDPPYNTIPNPYPTPPDPDSILGPNCTLVGTPPMVRPGYPPAPEPDWGAIFDTIEAAGARLIVHVFSAYLGVDFIKNWGQLEVNALPVGINVESQMQEFWDTAEGYCEYESFLASVGTATPIVPGVTDKFWNDYHTRWGHYPIYTAWGAYDAIKAINETITNAGTWPMSSGQMIPMFEKTDRQGLLGQFKYTGPEVLDMTPYMGFPWYLVAPLLDDGAATPEQALLEAKAVYGTYFDPGGINPNMQGTLHDVYCNIYSLTKYWPPPNYVRALMVQWQTASDGAMKVVWSQDQSYSRRFQIPPWMYEFDATDINYDGKVNVKDVFAAAKAFGSEPGHERWDIECDVNSDGKINVKDIFAIAKNFGKEADTWPLP